MLYYVYQMTVRVYFSSDEQLPPSGSRGRRTRFRAISVAAHRRPRQPAGRRVPAGHVARPRRPVHHGHVQLEPGRLRASSVTATVRVPRDRRLTCAH